MWVLLVEEMQASAEFGKGESSSRPRPCRHGTVRVQTDAPTRFGTATLDAPTLNSRCIQI